VQQLRLILIRHGSASYFERRIVAGATGCSGLTVEGQVQARKLCHRFQKPGELSDPVVVLSSPLARAMETARLLAPAFPGTDILPEPDLEEMSVGVADGMAWSEFSLQFGEFDVMAEPDRMWAPEGESWTMFTQRVRGFLDRVRHDYEDKTVVAVTHGGVIDLSMRELLGIPKTGTRASFFPSNTGLTEWSFQESWKLERYNDTSHLATR
jgi:probable phosphoglycerate mutase